MTHAQVRPLRTTRFARASAGAVAGLLLLGVAAPTPAAASTSLSERRSDVLHYTNQARKAAGCKPVKLSSRLNAAAQGHAKDMSYYEYFEHTSLDGWTWDERILAEGYPDPGGENIARGYRTGKSVVASWMKSRPHRYNIKTCDFRRMGVGYSSDGRYWVQDFGY